MAGVMLEPIQGTRVGVTYISPVKLDFKDRPSTKNLGPVFQSLQNNRGLFTRRLDLGLTVPQAVMASAYHELNDRIAIMGNLVWQDWSEVRQTRPLGRRHQRQQRDGQPQLRRHLGLRARGAVRVRGRLAVVVRRRLRQLSGWQR